MNDFNTNAMKVLSRIIQYVELPKVFINSYIKHVIGNFKNESKKDAKTKMARLIAFFITNLIEHKHLTQEGDIPDDIEELFTISSEEVDALKKKLIEMKQH